MKPPPGYRGRFAPSPSGPLHFGSLVAALGSFLEARVQQGAWLLRMEDVDPPRVVPGAADLILMALERYGFEWDGPVLWQSQRQEAYAAALEALALDGRVFYCTCSRKQVSELGRPGVDGPVYPGTCRHRRRADSASAARFRVPDERVSFDDLEQGVVSCDVGRECGDFVLRRADGVYSYQLAVVVDDAYQGITHVVRGADLLTSTPRQMLLHAALTLPTPVYRHLPIVLDGRGAKLSKQTRASPLDLQHPLPALLEAARFLGLGQPRDVASGPEFWAWALVAWHGRRASMLRGQSPAQPSASPMSVPSAKM